MQIYETNQIDVRLKYDIVDGVTSGEIYLKTEEGDKEKELWIGSITEGPKGTCKINVIKKFAYDSDIKEDLKKLKPEIVSFINMWHERASRGYC